MAKNKWYVGYYRGGNAKTVLTNDRVHRLIAFQCGVTPTYESHGILYAAVIGPFDTKRAAKWAEKYGLNNPHFTCVADAERISKNKMSTDGVTKFS